MSKPASTPANASAIPESFSAINGQALNFFTEAFTRWVKNANATSSELLHFVNARLNKDMQVLARFAECKKPEEFLALQSDVCASLFSDYAQESSKLFGMLTAAGEEAAARFTKHVTPMKNA